MLQLFSNITFLFHLSHLINATRRQSDSENSSIADDACSLPFTHSPNPRTAGAFLARLRAVWPNEQQPERIGFGEELYLKGI